MKNSTIITFVFCVAVLNAVAQQRNVHWIHGLGGNPTSWATFRGQFDAQRQIPVSTNGDYQTGAGVLTMANEISTNISSTAYGNSIGICHSMGGVAGRHLDVNNNGIFSGIVTFGSPLKGAKIVNSINNGQTNAYISNGITKLWKGPLGGINFWSAINITAQFVFNTSIQDFLADKVVGDISSGLQLTPLTSFHLGENSSYNQPFYNSSTTTPKIVLWGNETSPVHVRLASAKYDGIESNWVNGWNTVRQIYGSTKDFCSVMKWVNIFLYPLWNWRENRWEEGYDYLGGQSEDEWISMIGGGFMQTYTYQSLEYTGSEDSYRDYIDCVDRAWGDPDLLAACETTSWGWVTRTGYTFITEETDALVPRRSQIGENTSWVGNADVRELQGDNHLEMRSSTNSRNRLNEAFNGFLGGGNFSISQ